MSRHTGRRRFKNNPWNFIAKDQTKMPVDHEQFLRRLGQVIRQARKTKKMTQEDLSELAGVNAKYLGEVELGKTNLTIVFLLKLSWALGIEVTDVVFAASDLRTEGTLISTEILALLHKLDRSDLHKLQKILQLIVEQGRP